jgi:hypothetical protein
VRAPDRARDILSTWGLFLIHQSTSYKLTRIKKEDQVIKSIIPVIEGKIWDAKCAWGNIPFRNLSPNEKGGESKPEGGNLMPA